MIPKYNNVTFCNVWESAAKFLEDCKNADIELKIRDDSCTNLYYLLYAKYANNPIANFDIHQFKYKVYTTVFKFGGEWERKLEIQDTLRTMSESDIMKGNGGIYNHANNPSVAPSTSGTEELTYVDDQTYSKQKRGKLEAYEFLWSILNSDVTDDFLKKFEPCFAKFVDRNVEAIYCTDEDTDDVEEE